LKSFQVALFGLGALGITMIAFLDAGMVPLPGGPDAAVMTLSHLNNGMMPLYVFGAIVGSTLGCLIPYFIGRKTGNADDRRHNRVDLRQAGDRIQRIFAMQDLSVTTCRFQLLLQFTCVLRTADDGELRPEVDTLLPQTVDLPVRCKRDDAKSVGMPRDDIERVYADAAR